MPVYDYKCRTHGIFNELATFAESQQPQACPECQAPSPRVICLPPEIFKMPAELKKAHMTNEKAQHEPEFSSAERRKSDHVHKHGCGCSDKKVGLKLMYTAQGEKMFPGMRPWMISH